MMASEVLPVRSSTPLERSPGPVGYLRWAVRRWLGYSRSVQPPPALENNDLDAHAERALYGAAQPLLGLRLVLRDPELLRESLVPAAWLAVFCAVIALAKPEEGPLWVGRLKTFYKTFAILAPVPSVIFANHYARLAALVRWRLGFGACGPREQPLWVSVRRFVQQAVLVSVAIFPFEAVKAIPFAGKVLAEVILAGWALQWVVVEAFDDARVLLPGETWKSAEKAADFAPSPWFVRFFRWLAGRVPPRAPRFLVKLINRFANLCDKLSKPWREEIALLEKNGSLGTGFALATAALLAMPVLNLLFRPIIIVGSSHLLGHLEKEEVGAHLPAALAESEVPRDFAARGEG